MAKIGEDMLGDMAQLGLEELRSAVTGLDMPPAAQAPAAAAPVAEQPSYADMLNQAATSPAPSQDMELSR
jgi:hypothetical protein